MIVAVRFLIIYCDKAYLYFIIITLSNKYTMISRFDKKEMPHLQNSPQNLIRKWYIQRQNQYPQHKNTLSPALLVWYSYLESGVVKQTPIAKCSCFVSLKNHSMVTILQNMKTSLLKVCVEEWHAWERNNVTNGISIIQSLTVFK